MTIACIMIPHAHVNYYNSLTLLDFATLIIFASYEPTMLSFHSSITKIIPIKCVMVQKIGCKSLETNEIFSIFSEPN